MTPIKKALLEANRPQYVVSQETGIHETRISRLATGRATATESELESLSTVLGVPKHQLQQRSNRQSRARGGKGVN